MFAQQTSNSPSLFFFLLIVILVVKHGNRIPRPPAFLIVQLRSISVKSITLCSSTVLYHIISLSLPQPGFGPGGLREIPGLKNHRNVFFVCLFIFLFYFFKRLLYGSLPFSWAFSPWSLNFRYHLTAKRHICLFHARAFQAGKKVKKSSVQKYW